MRLQKIIAQTGKYSRRQADELILRGRVLLNGKPAKAGDTATLGDKIEIDEQKLTQISVPKVYIKMYKPVDYTCTTKKFEKEKNIFELVDLKTTLTIVGRLDKDSEGLLLLTNDGDLCQKLTHPSHQHSKTYEVYVQDMKKVPPKEIVIAFKDGVDIGEGDGMVQAKKIDYLGKNNFSIVLTQGKKRQLRRMFARFGLKITTLKRVKIESLELGDLAPGQYKMLTPQEIQSIKDIAQ